MPIINRMRNYREGMWMRAFPELKIDKKEKNDVNISNCYCLMHRHTNIKIVGNVIKKNTIEKFFMSLAKRVYSIKSKQYDGMGWGEENKNAHNT